MNDETFSIDEIRGRLLRNLIRLAESGNLPIVDHKQANQMMLVVDVRLRQYRVRIARQQTMTEEGGGLVSYLLEIRPPVGPGSSFTSDGIRYEHQLLFGHLWTALWEPYTHNLESVLAVSDQIVAECMADPQPDEDGRPTLTVMKRTDQE